MSYNTKERVLKFESNNMLYNISKLSNKGWLAVFYRWNNARGMLGEHENRSKKITSVARRHLCDVYSCCCSSRSCLFFLWVLWSCRWSHTSPQSLSFNCLHNNYNDNKMSEVYLKQYKRNNGAWQYYYPMYSLVDVKILARAVKRHDQYIN